jgi:hypothetical protein
MSSFEILDFNFQSSQKILVKLQLSVLHIGLMGQWQEHVVTIL